MGVLPRKPGWSLAFLAVLALIVVLLAVVQYRWIAELAEAERERLQARLTSSIEVFRDSFNRELSQILIAFRREAFRQPDTGWSSYAHWFEDWREFATHPELVRSFWVATTIRDGRSTAYRFDEGERNFSPAVLPETFAQIAHACATAAPGPPDMEQRSRPGSLWVLAFGDGRPVLMRGIYPARMPEGPWFAQPRQLTGYLFLELNKDFIYQELFPELAKRAFGDPAHSVFRVTVFRSGSADEPVYGSGAWEPASVSMTSDAKTSLLWDQDFGPSGESHSREDSRADGFRPGRRLLLAPCNSEDQWILAVRHQAGSVDQAVASFRRRNLAISGGVLVLLSLSILMIVVSAQRAQRLARMQMQFAAGISHEVRTPLAVIRSAGDNLAEGVVDSPDQIKEYGNLIRREGRRLSGLVEEALQFSSLQSGMKRYELVPVDVTAVIRGALTDLAHVIEESGFTIERHMGADLPAARADAEALSQCVQNLVANALKYGGEPRWIGVGVHLTESLYPITITIQDRGPGIAADDLPNIFDPFYQGRSPGGAKSRGAGLGLSLTKDMIAAMDGKITVETNPGKGTTFTLHLRGAGTQARSDES